MIENNEVNGSSTLFDPKCINEDGKKDKNMMIKSVD